MGATTKDVRVVLKNQLEKSVLPYSIIKTDFTGEAGYYSPSNALPTPIISLGYNYELQHLRDGSVNDLMSNTFSSTNKKGTGVSKKGSDWANDDIELGISFENDNFDYFLSSKPMIFMEVFTTKGNTKRSSKGDRYDAQWVHPTSTKGSLNRTGSNYGNGTSSSLITEWDLTVNKPYTDQRISLNKSGFYHDLSNLPQRKVDWAVNGKQQLKYAHGSGFSPSVNLQKVINYQQGIRFRFACIDVKDGKSVILGKPSEKLYISPKGGYFLTEDDYYWYDFQVKFGK